MVDCAIILAAGENRRMGGKVQAKALLPLADGTFLSRHIDLLAHHGVGRIFVIAHERLAHSFSRYEDARVRIIVSPFSRARVGSSLSLLCGLDAALQIDPTPTSIFMDADIVYESAVMNAVLEDSLGQSRLFVINRAAGDAEEVRVYGQGASTPVLLGKGLPGSLTHGLTLLGESVGIISLKRHDVRYCRDLIYWLSGSPPHATGYGYSGVMSEHEEICQYLFSLRRLGVQQIPEHFLFAECDTTEDYDHICKAVFPAIQSRDGQFSAHPERVTSRGTAERT
ncbi:MAG: NTP transferase domain-containing protein [Candidatus Sulfotelmatobacter sp.]|jgi:choline kinase